jgi:hypothetical protein
MYLFAGEDRRTARVSQFDSLVISLSPPARYEKVLETKTRYPIVLRIAGAKAGALISKGGERKAPPIMVVSSYR